jgi:hypothetical protein
VDHGTNLRDCGAGHLLCVAFGQTSTIDVEHSEKVAVSAINNGLEQPGRPAAPSIGPSSSSSRKADPGAVASACKPSRRFQMSSSALISTRMPFEAVGFKIVDGYPARVGALPFLPEATGVDRA